MSRGRLCCVVLCNVCAVFCCVLCCVVLCVVWCVTHPQLVREGEQPPPGLEEGDEAELAPLDGIGHAAVDLVLLLHHLVEVVQGEGEGGWVNRERVG